MLSTIHRIFLFRTGIDAGADRRHKTLFYLWNYGMLTLSAAGLCTVTLLLGMGVGSLELFFDYFRHPLIFLLNFLPVLLFELLMFCLINRVWAAYLATAAVFVTAAIGSYFKLRLRDDPFMFSDLTAIHTALGVAGGYDIAIDRRIALCLACVVLGLVLLMLFVRGRASGKARAVMAILAAVSIWPLWSFVYSSDTVYDEYTQNTEHIREWVSKNIFISKGFAYPFIHSITDSVDTPPEGYSEEAALKQLNEYSDADIPDDKRVNILAIQLEAFCDMTTLGLDGLENVYGDYHALEAESYTGNLISNVFAGGTVDTERCFLTGYTNLLEYRQNTNSYVWYLRSQGYAANGSHPSVQSFYNRVNVNSYLGFEDYHFTEGYYEKYGEPFSYDDTLFPEILGMFKSDIAEGKNVFSFNVTYQGHGPYETDELKWGEELWNGDVSEYSYYVINNYLGSVKDTISRIVELKEELEEMAEPVVLVLYGDHKPWLGDNSRTYAELGIDLDLSTREGFMNYSSTRYLIWANDAAREICDGDFLGEGPDISPCYLMGEVFSQIGWDGPAYMQLMSDAEDELPILGGNGFYEQDGKIVRDLSGRLLERNHQLSFVRYYMRNNFLYSEVLS